MVGTTAVVVLLAALPGALAGTFDLHRHTPPTPPPTQRRRRLTVDGTSVYGDVDTLGYYYSYLHIGEPPQKQTVIVDTGSSLVAVPCADCQRCGVHMDPPYDIRNSNTGRRLMCDNEQDESECKETTSIHSSDWGCNADGRCEFALSYTEGSHLIGHFVEDVVCIADDPCPKHAALPKIRFGCADEMGGLFSSQRADGIMGLGWGAEMALEPLRAEHGTGHGTLQLCLTHNGGFLTVGDGDQDVQSIRREGKTTWTPMLSKGAHPFFTVKTMMAKVAGASIDAEVHGIHGVPTILDSGSTYTYLPRTVWKQLKLNFDQFCAHPDKCHGQPSNVDPTSLHCIHGNDNMATFPSLAFYFQPTNGHQATELDTNPQLVLQPHEYFFPYLGSMCVGLIVDDNIARMEIGANFLQDHLVTFEPERNQVGFTKADCHAKKAKSRRASETTPTDAAAAAAPAPTDDAAPTVVVTAPTPPTAPVVMAAAAAAAAPPAAEEAAAQAAVPAAVPAAVAATPEVVVMAAAAPAAPAAATAAAPAAPAEPAEPAAPASAPLAPVKTQTAISVQAVRGGIVGTGGHYGHSGVAAMYLVVGCVAAIFGVVVWRATKVDEERNKNYLLDQPSTVAYFTDQ